MGRVWNWVAYKPRADEPEIAFDRRMAITTGEPAWGLVYVGDALRELAWAIQERPGTVKKDEDGPRG